MSDLISREAAIEAMEQTYCDIERVKKRPVTKGEQAIFMDMRGVIRSLPSVEPERKTGKWFLLDECANEGWYCDQCHKKVFRADFSNTMKKYKFCPNCGAKMEVEV